MRAPTAVDPGREVAVAGEARPTCGDVGVALVARRRFDFPPVRGIVASELRWVVPGQVWFLRPRGTAGPMHHRLGYDLPERTGFGGLWSAIDEHRAPAPVRTVVERHVVARSAGARSPAVQARLDAFARALQGPDAGAEDAAA